MPELRIVVDHEKLEYEGMFDAVKLFEIIEAWMLERHYERKEDKNHEQDTPDGKFIEWQATPWKKVTDYMRYSIKMRILISNLKKVETFVDKKRKHLHHGKVNIVIDAFMDTDYDVRWENKPFLIFLRTMYDKFFYKVYTERFENRLTYDARYLYHLLEKYFNMAAHFKQVSRTSKF